MELTNRINSLSTSSAAPKQALMRYGPIVLTALLVIWCASKLASITWLLFDKPSYDISTTTVSAPTTSAEGANVVAEQVDEIQRANLFGAFVPPPDGPVEVVQTDIPETPLTDLTLKGTVASTSDDNGLAIVERSGNENVFVVGDDIAPGIKLSRVFATEIHLSRNGVIEKLLLPKLSESPPTSNNRSSSRNRRPATRQQVSSNRNQGISSSAATKLGDLMRPQPVFQNGKMQGYRVYPGRKREQFKALGLKPGDLVTEVNGTPLEDPSKGLEIFRTLSENSQVSVTVQRNGAQTSLVLDTSQLNLGNQ